MAGSTERHDDFLRRVRPMSRAIRSVAAAWRRGDADRRDLEQEILAQAWRAFPRYDPDRPFSTWLYRIALNVAISGARAARREEARDAALAVEPPAGPPAGPARDDRPARLRAAVAELEPLSRALVTLHLEEHSHREIAEILGISETNVSTRLTRIRQRLRERLASEGGDHAAG